MTTTTTRAAGHTVPTARAARDFPRKSAMLRPDQLRFHPRNVRTAYTGLEELAASIRERGVLMPLLAHRRWITPVGQPEVVELLAGHRRMLAAEMAGLARVPVILRPRVADDEALLGFLAEDQKESLTCAERRDAIVALHEEFCYDLTEIARKLGMDLAAVRALYEGLDVAPARPRAAAPPGSRRRPAPRIRPTTVHALVAAWDADRLSGADLVTELRTMLDGWAPATTPTDGGDQPAATGAPATGAAAAGGADPLAVTS